MECTFRPRVNQRPPEEDDDLTHSRFDQLFWDAENRRRRQAEYDQWNPEGLVILWLIQAQSLCLFYTLVTSKCVLIV